MKSKQLNEMYAVESSHWWFSSKRALFLALLESRLGAAPLRILDAGCGSGAVAAEFGRFGPVVAMDRSLEALHLARSRGITTLVNADAASFPFPKDSFDLVLAFDVIEHIDDDAAFVSSLAGVLKPGGALAVHVPAWPFMWSRHDEILEHKRRYTLQSLRSLVQESGLVLEHIGWSTCSVFPAAAALRTLRRLSGREPESADLGVVAAPINSLLAMVGRCEARIAASVGLPFGLSLAAVAARPPTQCQL